MYFAVSVIMSIFARELEIKPKYMTLEEFLEVANAGKPLDTEEIHRFMDEASNEARRLTFRLNTAYHTPDEVRALLAAGIPADCTAMQAIGYKEAVACFRRSIPTSGATSM